METSSTMSATPVASPSAAIELRIGGADLLLAGRFLHWMPVTLVNGKNDEGLAQVLFDVTSNRAAAKGKGKDTRPLFEFQATSVKSTGPQTYRLKGRIKAGLSSGEVEARLESPRGHTPFFAITFTLDRSKFAALWSAFEERAAAAVANGVEELRPWAWLREPQLAAA
jgi:hypothetical protein